MDQEDRRNITLIGFSTSGKSTAGRTAAAKLGWRFVDTDDLVIATAGKTIDAVFADDGEERFRQLERTALEEALSGQDAIVATGGGAITREANRELMHLQSVVICLEARPETIYRRLVAESEEENPVVRPLLAGEDPLSRIGFLKEHRQPLYATADWTIHTDALTQDEVAEEIVRGWHFLSRAVAPGEQAKPAAAGGHEIKEADAPYCETHGAAAVVRTASATYPVFIGWGAIDDLGRRMRNAGLKGAAYVVSDSGVYPHWGPLVEGILREADFEVASYCVPAGEGSKSLDAAAGVYDWLIRHRAERGQAIVALGGGVVGDLAGFVAATYLRGVPLVQVPTTLLAMVDSSIGGKAAVNHPSGKNLVGAFYQPRLVLADVKTLTTLPRRELISGWAEVVKHALILDADLLYTLESSVEALCRLDPAVAPGIIARSTAIKADVVSQDEKETGIRITLNYGHTIGHAVEAATTYGSYLHGEAVAIGMMGAAMISRGLGLIPWEVVERQRLLLEKLDLPTSYGGAEKDQLRAAMALDKKVSGKAIRWVLLNGIGDAVVRSDVPFELVDSILDRLKADQS